MFEEISGQSFSSELEDEVAKYVCLWEAPTWVEIVALHHARVSRSLMPKRRGNVACECQAVSCLSSVTLMDAVIIVLCVLPCFFADGEKRGSERLKKRPRCLCTTGVGMIHVRGRLWPIFRFARACKHANFLCDASMTVAACNFTEARVLSLTMELANILFEQAEALCFLLASNSGLVSLALSSLLGAYHKVQVKGALSSRGR